MLKKTTVLLLIVLMVFGMGSQLVGAEEKGYSVKTSLVLPEKTDRGGGVVKSQPNGSVQPYSPGSKPKMEKEVMTVRNDKGQIFRTDNEKIPEKYREAIEWFNKNNPPNDEYSDGLVPVKSGDLSLNEKNINYKNNEVKAIYELYKPIVPDLRDKPVEFNGVTYEFKTPRYLLYDKNKNEVYDSFSGKVFPQALIDYEVDLGNKSINISKEKIKSNNAHYVKIKQYGLETRFMKIDQNKLNNSVSWLGGFQGNSFKEKIIDQSLEKESIISRIANRVRGLFK